MNVTEFDKIIWREAVTLVDFFAAWCGPCQAMHPVVDRFQEQMRGRADVVKVDIDARETESIVRRYEIRSVPTLIFFRHGKILWRSSGLMSFAQLSEVFRKLECGESVGENSMC